jgi:archaeal flagellar protein FlaJ
MKKIYLIAFGISLVIIASAFALVGTKYFFFVLGLGILIGAVPFVIISVYETNVANEKEAMFLEFARNLVESVNTGIPISRSIINVKNRPYGVLSENVEKLANQISMGIPLNTALKIFAKDVNNKNIARSLKLIGQAERAGGEIGEILESVAEAVNTSNKLKKERKSTISTLVVQGYIIFFVFIIIVLIMQFKILPMISDIALVEGTGELINQQTISNAFLYLLLIQALFNGFVVGKLAEGNIKAGVKHSFALMLASFLISTGANVFFG